MKVLPSIALALVAAQKKEQVLNLYFCIHFNTQDVKIKKNH
jgi:hypothetical protein